MTKEQPLTNCKFTKIDLKGKARTDRIDFSQGTNPLLETGTKVEIEGITTMETITGPIIGIDLGIPIDMTVEETITNLMIDKIIMDKEMGETTIDRTTGEITMGEIIEGTLETGKII